MIGGIYLSYDAIASIVIVVLMAVFGWVIGWFIRYLSRLNKKIDEISKRLNKIDVENAKRDERLDSLLAEKYHPYIKKVKK